jgi:hypothetical protein
MMGMHKFVFQKLVRELQRKARLCNTKHVSSEEQLTIFLRIAVTGLVNREQQERFH